MLRPHLLQVMALHCRPVKPAVSSAVQKATIRTLIHARPICMNLIPMFLINSWPTEKYCP